MRLNVLVVADSRLPVPPAGYGGAERMLAYVCAALTEAGHHVTLMGAQGSSVASVLVPYPWAGRGNSVWRAYCKARFRWSLSRTLATGPDVLLSSARVDYLLPALRLGVPTVYTFQNPILDRDAEVLRANAKGPLSLVAVSRSQLQGRTGPHWTVVTNGVDTDLLPFAPAAEQGYLAFLGRLTRNKGVDIAIDIARRTGMPLQIAGNISDAPGDRAYFDTQVAPQLGGDITWIGEIGDAQKPGFLGGARALLMPVRWEEPFGIVVAEALACGTPVIATPRGAMPELIRPGITGLLAASAADMVACVERVPHIDRRQCREDAEVRFSRRAMCSSYVRLIEAAAYAANAEHQAHS